jgi:hypothetical protein
MLSVKILKHSFRAPPRRFGEPLNLRAIRRKTSSVPSMKLELSENPFLSPGSVKRITGFLVITRERLKSWYATRYVKIYSAN